MRTPSMKKQGGVFLLEALIGILIFSLGILTLVAMQATAITAQSDAQFRTEAAKLAEQITSQVWLNIDRSSTATVVTSLATFQHHPTTTATCNYTGAASTNAVVTDWVAAATAAGTGLPGTTDSMLQVLVDTATYNQITVTVCWKTPKDIAARRHTMVTFVN
jgi:type IV pilus assembly protein PilV